MGLSLLILLVMFVGTLAFQTILTWIMEIFESTDEEGK